MSRRAGGLLLAGAVLLPLAAASGQAIPAERVKSLVARLRSHLDSLHAGGRFPGGTLGVALPDGRVVGLAVGYADSGKKLPMRATDLMLAGSVGKTFFAALALALAHEGRLALDDRIAKYLGGEPWFARMPNGNTITVRMLLNHTSGLDHYPNSPAFIRDFVTAVGRDPDQLWRPEELIGYAFQAGALFPAGQGWHYADTNYLVLALVLERATGTRAYDEIERRFLRPLRLTQVMPAVSRTIPGLAQGYAGPKNPFGGADAMMTQGRLVFNPRFEWGGGGFAATATRR